MKCCRGGCAALRRELRGPMFDLAEPRPSPKDDDDAPGGGALDVVRTFSPRPRPLYLAVKFLLFAWMVSDMAMTIARYQHPSFWLAKLTHWGLCLAVAYGMMSFITAAHLALRPPEDPGALEGGAGLLAKATWALFATVLPAEVIITILYWALVFDWSGPTKYTSVMNHGGVLVLIFIDGAVLSRIPLRMKQYILFGLFSFLYLLWTVIHAYAGLGNPYNDGVDKTDDAIYDSLAWKNDTVGAAILAVVVLFAACPVVFLLCRWASRLPPRRLLEPDARFRDQHGVEETEEDEEAAAVVY